MLVAAAAVLTYPFVPATDIGSTVIAELTQLMAARPAFDLRLLRTAWFGDEVLWLAPDDPRPLRALTDAAHAAFPHLPPYGGQFKDPVPHLTVAHSTALTQMRAAERAVREHLPIRARITAVTLLIQSDPAGMWEPLKRFSLGSSAG